MKKIIFDTFFLMLMIIALPYIGIAGQSITVAVSGDTGDSKTLVSRESKSFKLGSKEIDIYLGDNLVGTIKLTVSESGELKAKSNSMKLRVWTKLGKIKIKSASYPYHLRVSVLKEKKGLRVAIP